MKKLEKEKIKNKNIIFRADLNVPVVDGKITNYSRINSIAPSIKQLIINKNKVFIVAHYGRPKGQVIDNLSINFLCEELREKLKVSKVHFLKSFDNELIKKKLSEMNDGEICLFENIRFLEAEEKNDLVFSKNLSSNFDAYINDAFSASHRYHSSIVGLPKFLPSFAGLSFTKEIDNLNFFLNKSKKPNIAIIGGSKISTKIKLIYNLINFFDSIIIGGAMANTFLLSNNYTIGNSLVEKSYTEVAKDIQINALNKNCKIILPLDVVCSESLEDKTNIEKCNIDNVPSNKMILDIGEKTTDLISNEIFKCRSLLWNGPLGAFEFKPFDKGSNQVANFIQKNSKVLNIYALAGGGDTLSAINIAKADDGFDYLSNSGGAFLEWLEGNKSPGFLALEKNNL